MIPVFAKLDGRAQLTLAWLILASLILLIALPVILAATGLARSWQHETALRQDVALLSGRVQSHQDEILAWYLAQDETEDSVREYSDPDQARQAFDAELDLFSQTLIEAGAHLLQSPISRQEQLDDETAELVGEVGFSGALSDVLAAFIALEHSNIRLAGLTIEALPGEPAGRVRGRAQLRHAYLTVSPDDS